MNGAPTDKALRCRGVRRLARASRPQAFLVAALSLLITSTVMAGTLAPYGGDFRTRVEVTFFDPPETGDLGRVSPVKVAAYRELIERKLRALEGHIVNYETIEKGESEAEAVEEFHKSDTAIALEHIRRLLDRMESGVEASTAYSIAGEILMIEYATRAFTEPIGSVKIPVHVKNVFNEWRIPNASRARNARREASNLFDPETGLFYTPDELAELIRSGFDISELNPPRETQFWRARDDIAGVDVIPNYLNGGDPMHEGIVSEFPEYDGAEFVLQKAHMTQSKPKLDVYYLDENCRKKKAKQQKKCRQTLKLKFGMETHADPTANALLSVLGFNADVSMHLKNVKVYLGKRTRDEVERDWIGYFDRQRIHTYIPMDSVLLEGEAGRGEDEKGEYFIFEEAVAELKSPELDRIGLWSFSLGMPAEAREARGLFVFNAWIANADMKDEENNKLVLRKTPSGDRRMYLVQQDIGHSMGWILPERPEAFTWDLIETNATSSLFGWVNGSIEFNYINLQDAGLEHTTTYADAKWMARRIAQFTREQVVDAVSLGRWPGGIGPLYVEKLINRRNQLVEAFDLEDEFALMAVDRHITTADGSVVDGHLVRNNFEGSPINFDNHWKDAIGPINRWVLDRAAEGLGAAVSTVDVINPGNIAITGKLAAFPRILAHLSRQILLNPDPRGAWDQWVVLDSMEVGVRMGIGYIGSAEGTLVKKYALAYPVATRHEGIYSGIGIIDFMLPYDVWKGDLPEKYVLYREHAYKAGVRISTDHSPFLSPFGLDGDQNWVWSHRSVIDRREDVPLVWVDRPRSLERNAHMFVELAVLQIPFLGGGTSKGTVEGEIWRIDPAKLDVPGEDGEAIFDALVRKGDFTGIEKIALDRPRGASSEFSSNEVWWNLLFANWRQRASEQTITLEDGVGNPLREERQTERRNRFSWSLLDNGETQEFRVTGFLGAAGADGKITGEPVVVVHYSIDDLNTHSDEFDSYHALLEGIGAGQTYLVEDFEATDWEVSGELEGRWTRMLTDGTIHLDASALEKLIGVDPTAYWRQLAVNLGISHGELSRQRELTRPSASKDTLVARRSPAMRWMRSLIRRSDRVLKLLARAGGEEEAADRIRLVVEALYRSSYRLGDTFNPVILATLLEESGAAESIESGAMAVDARVTKAFKDEQNLPERRDIVGQLGTDPGFEEVRYRFFPFDGIELYNMLNWVSANE